MQMFNFIQALVIQMLKKTIFDNLSSKAYVMHYWKGPRQLLKETPMRYYMDDDTNLSLKLGPVEN